MSTTLIVKARAWGAAVAVTLEGNTESFTLQPHEDWGLIIGPGQEITVKVSEPAEAPMPEPVEEPAAVDAADPQVAPVTGAEKFDHDGDGRVGGGKAKTPKSGRDFGDED